MRPIVTLICPQHRQPLVTEPAGEDIFEKTAALNCPSGCRFPVVGGIPRFVPKENYAAAFGHQWKAFRRTQLDSYTGTDITRRRLERCLGGSLDVVKGKRVLEAGCGAGRFTEILLAAGAKVFACDLSVAVEANRENCGQAADYFVCQADIGNLPVEQGAFDIVICLGVIQHTPDPDQTIATLCSHVASGGLLVIDHYRYSAEEMSRTRQAVRNILVRTSPRVSLAAIRATVAMLWPIHRLLWATRKLPYGAVLRQKWLNVSPVLDYHDAYIQLGPKLLYAWAALDTHDALTDRYKFKRTVEEIRKCLARCGMEAVEAYYGGNGVEARARKPVASMSKNEHAAVADYWTRYNVTAHERFASAAESLAYLSWRNDQYLGYSELMPVDGQDGKVVLDFGCGPGHDLVGFATSSKPARLIGVDVSPSSLAQARERLSLHPSPCEFVQLDPNSSTLPFEDASVDHLHSSGVLHHLPDAVPFLREFRRVLKPTGSARIMIYNRDSVWMHLFVAYLKKIVESAYAELTLDEAFAKTTDGEDCPIARVARPDDFVSLVRDAGFDGVFTGAAVSMHEAKILPYRFDAIQHRRTPEPSRRFLLELTYDDHGMPCYRGKRAGVDACFSLTPR